MKRLILDTQVFLWWLMDSDEMGSNTRAMIGDRNNRIFISPITIWELSLKKKQGIIEGLPEIHQIVEEEGFEELKIDAHHCQFAAEYGEDALFRSMLMAQTQSEGAVLVTDDQSYDQYGIRTWNARR